MRQADQLGGLIDALFELARLESGAVAPRLEAFSIAELLQDVALRFRMAAEKRGVALHTLLDVSGIMVFADLELIERVLGNLLENAVRHTPRGGQVRIEMSIETELVRIRVIDTGQGCSRLTTKWRPKCRKTTRERAHHRGASQRQSMGASYCHPGDGNLVWFAWRSRCAGVLCLHQKRVERSGSPPLALTAKSRQQVDKTPGLASAF